MKGLEGILVGKKSRSKFTSKNLEGWFGELRKIDEEASSKIKEIITEIRKEYGGKILKEILDNYILKLYDVSMEKAGEVLIFQRQILRNILGNLEILLSLGKKGIKKFLKNKKIFKILLEYARGEPLINKSILLIFRNLMENVDEKTFKEISKKLSELFEKGREVYASALLNTLFSRLKRIEELKFHYKNSKNKDFLKAILDVEREKDLKFYTIFKNKDFLEVIFNCNSEIYSPEGFFNCIYKVIYESPLEDLPKIFEILNKIRKEKGCDLMISPLMSDIPPEEIAEYLQKFYKITKNKDFSDLIKHFGERFLLIPLLHHLHKMIKENSLEDLQETFKILNNKIFKEKGFTSIFTNNYEQGMITLLDVLRHLPKGYRAFFLDTLEKILEDDPSIEDKIRKRELNPYSLIYILGEIIGKKSKTKDIDKIIFEIIRIWKEKPKFLDGLYDFFRDDRIRLPYKIDSFEVIEYFLDIFRRISQRLPSNAVRWLLYSSFQVDNKAEREEFCNTLEKILISEKYTLFKKMLEKGYHAYNLLDLLKILIKYGEKDTEKVMDRIVELSRGKLEVASALCRFSAILFKYHLSKESVLRRIVPYDSIVGFIMRIPAKTFLRISQQKDTQDIELYLEYRFFGFPEEFLEKSKPISKEFLEVYKELIGYLLLGDSPQKEEELKAGVEEIKKKLIKIVEKYSSNESILEGIFLERLPKDPIILDYLFRTKDNIRDAFEKAKLGKALGEIGIEVPLEDGTLEGFISKIVEIIKKKLGLSIDPSKYSLRELVNIISGYIKLMEKPQKETFKKLTENYIFGENYWKNKEVEEVLKDLEGIINTKAIKGRILKIWSWEGKEMKLDYGRIVEAFVYTMIGSRKIPKKELEKYEKELKNIFGEKKVESAKGFFRSSVLPKLRGTGKIKEIGKLLERKEYDRVIEIIDEVFQKVGKDKERNKSIEFLSDIINGIKGIKKGGIVGGKYVVAFTHRYPCVMFSNHSTGSCSHLPDGVNKYGSVLYLLDPRVVYIAFSLVEDTRKIRERGEIDGMVIMYLGRTRDGVVLVVDSVEMGPRLFFPNADKWFNKNWEEVYKIILDYARAIGVDRVIFNKRTTNRAPRYFLDKIKFLKEDTLEVMLIGDKDIPVDEFKDGRHYLEAFGVWRVPGGKIRGYVVDPKLIKRKNGVEYYITTPRDWERIREGIMGVENRSFEEDVREDEENIGETFKNPRSVCVIAVKDGKIIGYSMALPAEDKEFLDYYPERTLYIGSTAVLPEHRGKGIATEMKRIMIDIAKKKGYEHIAAHITHPAIRKIYDEMVEERLLKYYKIIERIEKWVGGRDAEYVIAKIG